MDAKRDLIEVEEGRPTPGPDRIRPLDRGLIEWVAHAEAGERIPEPWRWASSPTQSVILRLIDLRVIRAPSPGTDPGDVVRAAALSAQAWLASHPADSGDGSVEPSPAVPESGA